MSNNLPFKLEDIKKQINEIKFTTPVKNDIVPNQLISFPKLDGKFLDIQLPFIKMTHGGFPQKGNPLYDGFKQRANGISFPIQKDDDIYVFLKSLQELIIENLDSLIPEDKKKNEIDFQDIIREYENQKKNITEYSFRVRLALKIKDEKKEDYEVVTDIWELKDNNVTNINVKTVEDVEKYIRYGSDVQFIIRLNKLYINNKNDGTKKDPKYKMGVTFKIMSAQFKSNKTTNNIVYKNNYVFNNDDDDIKQITNNIQNIDIDTSNLDIDTSNLDIDSNDE
jgi:hypothetical protein